MPYIFKATFNDWDGTNKVFYFEVEDLEKSLANIKENLELIHAGFIHFEFASCETFKQHVELNEFSDNLGREISEENEFFGLLNKLTLFNEEGFSREEFKRLAFLSEKHNGKVRRLTF